MARKGGYHLLATDIINSDEDDDKVLFDSATDAGDGWSEGEENLNIFAESSRNDQSKKVEAVELRARNGGSSKSLQEDEAAGCPSSSRGGDRSKSSNGSSNNGAVLLERRVRKDDTLQKISLQFSIAISELKRVNGFIADTDLFARDIIKIPVQRYGYNHALIMAELDGTDSAPHCDSIAAASSSSGIPSTAPAVINAPVQAERLLQTVDANVQKAQRQLEQRRHSRDVFNADNGFDDDHMLDARFSHGGGHGSQSRNSHVWLERSVRHFVAVVLLIFIFIGLPVLLYVLYKSGSQGHPHGSTAANSH